MEPWVLLGLQVALLSAFPFIFIWLDRSLRTTLFFVYLGVLLAAAGTLGAVYSLPLTDTISASIGGITYSALIMTTMMMVLISGDLGVVRGAIRLVVVVNLFVLVVLAITSAALDAPDTINPFGTSPEIFRVPIWSAIVGGLLNVGQLALITVALERLKGRVTRLPLLIGCYLGVFTAALAIDGALFPTLLLLVEPGFEDLLASGVAGVQSKLVLAAAYALPLAAFMVVTRSRVAAFQDVTLPLSELFVAPRTKLIGQIERQRSELDVRSSLLQVAGQVAQLGGWALQVPDRSLTWTPEVFTLFDHEADGSIHLDAALAVHPSGQRELLQSALDQCIQDGTPFDLELEAETAAGRHIWTRVVAKAQYDDHDQISGIVGAYQDISARKAAEEATSALAARLRDTLESVTDGLFILDRAGRFSYLNAAAERLFGHPREDLLGERMDVRFPQESDSRFHVAYERAMTEGTAQSMVEFSEPLGIWIEAEAYPSEQGLAVYFRDVTVRIEREQMLEQVAAAEQAAAEQLRHLSRAKDSFLTAVSHELRTPLTVVQGMAETLQRVGPELDPQRRETMETALANNADRLSRLLDDLLDIDRLSHGVMSIRPSSFDIAEQARRIVGLSSVADRVRLDGPEQLLVDADQVRCERILVNLLDNAGKYAPTGEVVLRLRRLADVGVRIEIQDQGPGIPADELLEVFKPFHRADNDHPQPGTGIGLALVAQFASLHGGRAWARDTHGQGAHLIVELPGNLSPAVTDG